MLLNKVSLEFLCTSFFHGIWCLIDQKCFNFKSNQDLNKGCATLNNIIPVNSLQIMQSSTFRLNDKNPIGFQSYTKGSYLRLTLLW